ncbi:unnamed protein product, partial [Owenia fusiformis]
FIATAQYSLRSTINMIKSVNCFVLLLVLITQILDVNAANASCLDPGTDWKCNPRAYRPCPNTYKCLKSEGFKCCQYKIEKDMPNCKNMWMQYEVIPWGCRGGGSRPCPSSYKCRAGPGNTYSVCCEYITCEHPPGYIHPKDDGEWYDVDGCTKCECISQDNHQCKLTTKCMKKRTCDGQTNQTRFAEGDKCVQCTCDTKLGKMTCENMCCKNYGPTKKLTNEDCKECTSCSRYSEDPQTETVSNRRINDKTGDCIYSHGIIIQRPCPCEHENEKTKIEINENCYKCQCTDGVLKNCTKCVCGKNQKSMDFMDNGKCVACRCNKRNAAVCVQCPNKDSSKLCKRCKEGETEGRNQHLTLKKASFLISIIFTNCIRVSSRE